MSYILCILAADNNNSASGAAPRSGETLNNKRNKLKGFPHPYLWDMDGVRLPMEDRRIIIHVSNLDVYCVFHHLRGETPW